MTSYFTIESEDKHIRFSIGYDYKNKVYYMPSIAFTKDKKEEYWDNIDWLQGLHTSLREGSLKGKYYQELKRQLIKLNIPHTREFDLELLGVLSLAHDLNYLKDEK